MRRAVAILLGLLLLAMPAASQQVPNPMSKDAANATPEARENLQIGTVRSEGANPPNADAVTRFYTYGGAGSAPADYSNMVQFEIASHPGGNERAIEQAGLPPPGGVGIGQGATRICWTDWGTVAVNCNFVAKNSGGKHRFANGAGFLTEIAYQGIGATNGWPLLLATDTAIARITAGGATDTTLELRAKGNAGINFYNDVGGKLVVMDNGTGTVNDRYIRLIGGTVLSEPRIQGYSDAAPDVTLRVMGKGTGGITFENDRGILGRFDSSGSTATRVWLRFIGGDGTLAVLGSESLNFADVPIYMVAQGKGNVIIANQDDVDGGNNLVTFTSKTGGYNFGFNQQDTAGRPGSIGSSGGAMNFYGHRFRSICPSGAADPWPPTYPCIPAGSTIANFAVTIPDSGTHYTNAGSGGFMNFYLHPATATSIGAHFCFTRNDAQTMRITAYTGERIAIAPTNSAAGGYIQTTGDFASICLETHKAGQWTAYATPDKTQWTFGP